MRKIVAFLFIVSSLAAKGQTSVKDKLDSVTRVLIDQRVFRGSILVAQDDSILFQRSSGYEDHATGRTLSSESAFYLCSISKVLTATAVLKLVQNDQLKLSDKVARYFPGLPNADVTIKNLLNHTSGLPDYINELYVPHWVNNNTPDSLRKITSNQETIDFLILSYPGNHFKTGRYFEYMNTNYVLLASIIEKVTGKSFNDYLDETLFNPLGMTNTYVYRRDTIPDKVTGYDYSFYSDSATVSDVGVLAGVYGDGGIYSNATDLLKFTIAYRNNEIIDAQLRSNATTSIDLYKRWYYYAASVTSLMLAAFCLFFLRGKKRITFASIVVFVSVGVGALGYNEGRHDIPAYGMGWETISYHGNKVAYHTGGWGGFRTMLWQENGVCIVVLANNALCPTFDLARTFSDIVHHRQPAPVNPPLATTYCVNIRKGETIEDAIAQTKTQWEIVKRFPSRLSQEEEQLNATGYEFLHTNDLMNATAVFRLNTDLFPDSWNAFDSYGEVLARQGKTEEAINAYQKSLSLHPQNSNAAARLKRLRE